jgi:LAO/AO transport system kinase
MNELFSSQQSVNEEIVGRLLQGDQRTAARMISLIEDNDSSVAALMLQIFQHTGKAVVVGVTGPPGAGKSTLVQRMARVWRERDLTVGVLAIDPSSSFTGGAILGDRIRMSSLDCDRGVFIRSMASRSHLGGIAEATPAAIRVLDAMGMDIVIVETVGVGQSEIAIADAADCTVFVTMPGTGDAVQTMKAGVMEIGNVFVVNKADHEGALSTQREIRSMLHLLEQTPAPPVLLARADTGAGVDDLVMEIDKFVSVIASSGELEERRFQHLQHETLDLIGLHARRQSILALAQDSLLGLTAALRERKLDPASVAELVLAKVWSPDRQ